MYSRTKSKLTLMKIKAFDTVASVLLVLTILVYCDADAQTDGQSTIPTDDCKKLLAFATETAEDAANLAKQLNDELESEREASRNVMSLMLKANEEQSQLILDLYKHVVAAEAIATEFGSVLVKGKSLSDICDSKQCVDQLSEISEKEKEHMKRTKEFEEQIDEFLDSTRDQIEVLRKRGEE